MQIVLRRVAIAFLLTTTTLSATSAKMQQSVNINVDVQPLDKPTACTGQFVAHDLDHITTVPGGENVRMFEANGAGIGINDLDNDGDLDIVLANHAGANSILWNEGQLAFTTQRMSASESRGINLIDYNGDGQIDLFFTRIDSAPNLWLNEGNGRFTKTFVSGLAEPLYTTTWGDLDGDNDLDLVGATYDAALLNTFGQDFLMNGRGGVYIYENNEQKLSPLRLAREAQALALLLTDANGDQRLDVLVGNDFAVPDFAWFQTDAGWEIARPFPTTSHSTMSLDVADVDNDGQREIFSTDMKPYQNDDQTLAAWEPIISSAPHRNAGDPQIPSNVMEVLHGTTFQDEAPTRNVDATGWSWSGKFGDLDQDGFVDLYVVNGMIEQTIFGHLPDHELVEENQVFRNDGAGNFERVPTWQLDSTRSGRGMSMADLDRDGDLDIVVNNLRGAAQLFENQLCSGRSLLVDLRWPESDNTYAIGSHLYLHTSIGTLHRDVRVASGYLSGDPSQVHFGIPEGATMNMLEIIWPDGMKTQIETLNNHTHLSVHRASH